MAFYNLYCTVNATASLCTQAWTYLRREILESERSSEG